MKKTLLFTGLLSLSFSINAQTISSTSVISLGDTLISATDVSPSINIGSTGTGNTWNFSSLIPNNTDTVVFSDPSSISCASTDFSSASFKFEQDTLMGFLEKSATKIELLGISNGTICAASQNPETMIEFPSTYGSTFTDSSATVKTVSGAEAGEPLVDSVKIENNTLITSNFNASGTLTTSLGVFSTIRQYLVRISTTKIYGKSPFTGPNFVLLDTEVDTAYSHQYWSNHADAKFPLVTYDLDMSGNLTGDVSWTTKFASNPALTSISEIENKSIAIYPNPVNNQLNLDVQDKINALTITDITGKVVLRTENKNDKNIPVDFLNKGIYIITIETDSYLGTSKFIKN